MPNSPDDRHLEEQEEQILAADASRQGWQRRAVGVSQQDALATIPKARQMVTSIRIEPWRVIHAHIKGRGLTVGEWVRTAIINQYVSEGGDRKVARDADITRRIHN